MKRVFIAAVALSAISLSSSAFAQDWWSGPEIGVQGGYAWGTSSGNITTNHGASFPYNFSVDGALGGAHAGYNFQFDHIVLGIEGDAEGAGVSGTGTDATNTFSIHSSMDFDGSVRGKLGYSFDRVLLYGTGGVAFGDISTTYTPVGSNVQFGATKGVRVGWTAGGGLDYAIDRNWEIGVEYRYTDLGTQGFTKTITPGGIGNIRVLPPTTFSDNNSFTFNAVRAVLTYRFAPPPPPPPPMVVPAVAPAPPPAPPRTFLVFFDFDRYNLTPDARRVIEAAAASYKATGSARIDVSGFTDLAGTQAYNLRLSQRRADAVAGYLMKQGVPKNVMDVKWFGKEHPRVPTPDGVREPQNRRVEIMMP